jgi:hypothetical protein
VINKIDSRPVGASLGHGTRRWRMRGTRLFVFSTRYGKA